MTKEIQKEKLPVVMKGGLVHWLSEETHMKLQTALSAQSAHAFVRLNDLGITINTAEIEGVYTKEQYEDMGRIKQGMWHCAYGKWHEKKGTCECKQDALRRARQVREDAEEAEKKRPQTDEELAAGRKALDETRANLERRGILPKKITS